MQPISEMIWDKKYRLKHFDGTPIDITVEDTWRRVASALAEAEKPDQRVYWADRFYEALEGYKFIPAGRIMAGAGTERQVTLFNCFVMGTIPDSMDGIFDALKEAALTMQQGGGIGYDFSTIRPRGAEVKGVAADASGPLTFMDVWDAACRTIMSAGSRRGAMMATMRCDHPDIEAFIEAKRDPLRLRNFNLSVLVTDAFMEAVKADVMWALQFGGKVYKEVSAVELWNRIMRATYDVAEPGVIFIDRINQGNPLNYLETIAATNPCGEQPLPPYGACLLGSINLARFVKKPFEKQAKLNRLGIKNLVYTAVRMMDNVIDVTNFPLPQQAEEARNKRRIGLGVTGLADALLMLGITYGSDKAVEFVDEVMSLIAHQCYLAGAELASEKGVFPLFSAEDYLNHPYIQQFGDAVYSNIVTHGLRNSHYTSIAPTGTISLYAGNVSSGIEPVFAYNYTRKVRQKDGSHANEQVEDYAYAAYRKRFDDSPDNEPWEWSDDLLPGYFVSAQTLSPDAHVRMQAAAQKWVDSAISKTVNVPEDIGFEDFKAVYEKAHEAGCKGCTTYRPNDVTGSVLSVEPAKPIEEVAEPNPRPGAENWADTHERMKDKPAPRPKELSGNTYKLKWPGTEHALYITINDDAAGRPFEIFINSKDTEHFAWTVALTRMISGVFRRGGDVGFVAEELKAVFDPRGGAWVEGKYVPSILAAIGSVIEKHISSRVAPEVLTLKINQGDIAAEMLSDMKKAFFGSSSRAHMFVGTEPRFNYHHGGAAPKPCPKCSSFNTKNESGCFQCLDCGESKCG